MSNPFERDCLNGLIERSRNGAINRRTFIKAVGLLASLPIAMRSGVTWAADRQLVVVNWGGDSVDAFRKAWARTFTEATGIEVKIDGSGPTLGAVKAQATSGNVSWDLFDAEPYIAGMLGPEGLLRPIDYGIVDRTNVRKGLDREYGCGNYLYSYVMARDTAALGGEQPSTWADFWDTERFPQWRIMYKWLNGVMEAALLADNVASEDLYPLDVERAFAKIERLKPHILSFWSSGAESQELMLSGEAPLGMIWNTRAMQMERDSDGRIQWSYDNGFLNPSLWAVLNGNPGGHDAAMQFIAAAQDPQSQVVLFNEMAGGPANPAADKLIPEDKRHLNCASQENMEKQILLDMDWYTENYAQSLERFLAVISN